MSSLTSRIIYWLELAEVALRGNSNVRAGRGAAGSVRSGAHAGAKVDAGGGLGTDDESDGGFDPGVR